jgi:hypothetical protein
MSIFFCFRFRVLAWPGKMFLFGIGNCSLLGLLSESGVL